MKILRILPLTLLLLAVSFSTSQTFAAGQSFDFQQPTGFGVGAGIAKGAKAEGLVETIISNVISMLFAIGGLGVLVYFVWGAVDWIFSGGDKEKVSNARKKMTNAIIGLALLSLSYVIINIVGEVVGFNPLRDLQLRGLGDNPQTGSPIIPNAPGP
jgi:hypothetical protein